MRWFIDGSFFDGDFRVTARTGFGVAAVGAMGDLLACGYGVPPDWVHEAAGAETWAYVSVVREALEVPRVVTD